MRIPTWHTALAVALSTVTAMPAAAPPQRDKPYAERVDVHRLLVDVRVTDGAGQPIGDLAKADFSVRIDGKPVPVESATWVAGAVGRGETGAAPTRLPAGTRRPQVEGRLIVFLIQKDLEPSRINGLMGLLAEAGPLLASFTPRDRVAVLSFDSGLRIWTDFTNDRDRVRAILQDEILVSDPPALVESQAPSLVAGLGARQAQRASTMEKALALLGGALEPMRGAKSVILFGHGFGNFGSNGVTLASDYAEARRSLRNARASVFSLDVTQADYHSLEAGLQQVADDTGGFFERTHVLPARVLNRLAGTLAGHYVLIVERLPVRRGRHRVEVSVPHPSATVLVRDFVD
jgi:VWFA-related protein